ncbi:hypothetical protein PR048_002540 [Dryococelus australis]|uniref:Uncharacterized protein n=1 Tax=Dryococelus australis TaxID=614101 RepID=A0ABQ9IKK4_9NEOP|nr:hypothetical protein PR048_002540 [Dryococelus australis]
MAIEHSGIVISTDFIKTKLLDMEGDVGDIGNAFAGKTFLDSGHSRHYQKRDGNNASNNRKNDRDLSSV